MPIATPNSTTGETSTIPKRSSIRRHDRPPSRQKEQLKDDKDRGCGEDKQYDSYIE
jgi:hypothetical protein